MFFYKSRLGPLNFERKDKDTTWYPLCKNVFQKTKYEVFSENTILVFISNNTFRQRRICKKFPRISFSVGFISRKSIHYFIRRRKTRILNVPKDLFIKSAFWVLLTNNSPNKLSQILWHTSITFPHSHSWFCSHGKDNGIVSVRLCQLPITPVRAKTSQT